MLGMRSVENNVLVIYVHQSGRGVLTNTLLMVGLNRCRNQGGNLRTGSRINPMVVGIWVYLREG